MAHSVTEADLDSRLDFLKRTQNADGGWGYFAGKQSWMEPTAYAILALKGSPHSDEAIRRAWKLAQSWQMPDGGWQPGSQVRESTWVAALGVIVASCLGCLDVAGPKTVPWLLSTKGQESRWAVRLASYVHLLKTDVNVTHSGWPWRPGNSSWIEPTALTVVALKRSLLWKSDHHVNARIRDGEELILSRRGRDGGWNSGNPSVLKYDVPSYPETTALALIGLQGRGNENLSEPLSAAEKLYGQCKSSLAKAWLTIALRSYGVAAPESVKVPGTPDILLYALQALGHPSGNYRFLGPGSPS